MESFPIGATFNPTGSEAEFMDFRARVRELFAQGSRNWDRGLLGSTFGEDQRKVVQEPMRDRLIWKGRVVVVLVCQRGLLGRVKLFGGCCGSVISTRG